MNSGSWGNETQYFYSLTPEEVLTSVEHAGYSCTGRCYALNSMENRVYDVEIELDSEENFEENTSIRQKRRSVIVKFYRPGRWSQKQIQEEHEFLKNLEENEIPVVAPILFQDGQTLRQTEAGIWYTLFPKIGGRSVEEIQDESLEMLGRLVARIHNVGASQKSVHRLKLSPETYGLNHLKYLMSEKKIPLHLEREYENVVKAICEIATPWFEETTIHRIHGDNHLGNLLWDPNKGFFFIDFDDMLNGPAVQDFWLLMPFQVDHEGKWLPEVRERLEKFLIGYEQMRIFDRRSLRLIEPLRALRFIHFSAWISKRWEDPAFQNAFPHFGTNQYWQEQVQDLKEQLRLIQSWSQPF